MGVSFQVRGESGLDTVIESPLVSAPNLDGTGPNCVRALYSYSLTNGDHLDLNDDGSFTNIRTKEILRRI